MVLMNSGKRLAPFSGILGVAIIWLGVGTAMSRAGLRFIDSRPISYLGVTPNTSHLFSITLISSALLFILFGFYLRSKIQTSNKFLVLLIIGQIIAAITPYGKAEPARSIHTYAAFTLAFSLPLLISAFQNSLKKTSYNNLLKLLVGIECTTFFVGIGLFVFTKGIAPLGEALPAIGFHVWIIVVTFLVIRAPK
jgi:hypothetical membrane protein